jgi:aminopeptidase YwaD
VERQGFRFPYFLDKGSELSISQPVREELHPLTLGLSAPGRVEAEARSAGLGRPEDIAGKGLQGRIALIERGEITFQDKVKNVARAGARAAVIFNNSQGNFRGKLAEVAPIPAISLSQEEGQRLLELLERGPVRLRLSVTATSEERRSENIIATGKGEGAPVLIFGAHYDSVEAGPGANDNASGVAVMLELARVLAREGFPLSVRFIAFGAEEQGLLGSREYVSRLSPAGRSAIRAMVSLDMVGVGDRLRFGGSERLLDKSLAVARGLGLAASALGGSGAGASDHASFLAADIPAVLFHYTVGVDLDPRYHTAQDRAEFVRPENLATAALVGLGLARALMEPGQG